MMSPWNPSGWRHRKEETFFLSKARHYHQGVKEWGENAEQLVVPTKFCHEFMMMAHGVKLAAHLGVDKSTYQESLSRLFLAGPAEKYEGILPDM